MAVPAYASVLSLLRVIDNAQHPSRLRLFPDATQIDSLREKICSLQDFFELHSSTITEDVESIARKIPRVALEAEILIDNYVVDQLYNELQDLQNDTVAESFKSFHGEMHRVMQQIESITEALTELRTSQQKPARVQLDKFTCNEPLTNKVVGFDDQLQQLLEKLTGSQKGLVIVPIVGMGGIGKTTLARSVFDHPYNLHHFHVRIWLTISQDYSVQRVLQELLKILGNEESGDKSESVLITKLHQKLFGQRYLVVLDDVWSLEAWHDLRRGLPDNGNASRVLVTTRLSQIATSIGSDSYSMKFLDEDASWDLFSQRAFERGGGSHELEGIGRVISKRCKGLPLLLVVVGGLLASSNMSVEHWQTVAEDISSFVNSEADDYCSRVCR